MGVGGHTAPTVPWITAGSEDTRPGPSGQTVVRSRSNAQRNVFKLENEENLIEEKRTPRAESGGPAGLTEH